jgi:hypothetical protein
MKRVAQLDPEAAPDRPSFGRESGGSGGAACRRAARAITQRRQSLSGDRDYGLPWPLAFGPALSE